MANFKVGDKVVCMDAFPKTDWPHDTLTAGVFYTVGLVNELCAGMKEILGQDLGICHVCGATDEYVHYEHWRFIKLDGLTEDTTEKHELETY